MPARFARSAHERDNRKAGTSLGTMMRRFLAFLLCAALPMPAFAQAHVIAQLGTAPLVGQVASTGQLQNDLRRQRALFETAGTRLGLTPAEFAQFAQRIEQGRLTYVKIPRHLDAMSWKSRGSIHVLHDVVIPANTMGWEVDVPEHGQIVAIFIPNKCGNLSVLRRPVPLVAQTHVAPAPPPARVEAAQTAPPAPSPAPSAAPAQVAMPAAPSTPPPYGNIAESTAPAPATHHLRLWPLLLLPLIALFGSHGSSSSPLGPAPPTPPPAGCPQAVPITH